MARLGFDSNYGGKAYDTTHFGGYSTDVQPGADGVSTVVSTGQNDEVQRYRGLGEAAAQRQAYNPNFQMANADRVNGLVDRNMQSDAANMQRMAASGQAPSRAEIEGNQVAGQSLEASLGAQAGSKTFGTRSAPGLAAAGAAAQQAQAGMQLGGMGHSMAGRSAETGTALGAYGAGMSNIRRGDYGAMGLSQEQADARAQSEMAQRQMNDQAQMSYEQRGFDVNKAELSRNLRQKDIYAKVQAEQSKNEQQNQDRNLKWYGATVGAVGSGVGAAGSDERMKEDIVPLTYGLTTSTRDPKNTQKGMAARQAERQAQHDAAKRDAEQRRQLHRAMGNEVDFQRNVMGEDPYATGVKDDPRAYAAGPQAAPKGYAASRAGQPGSMFGGPETSASERPGDAPGMDDYRRYGGASDKGKPMDDYSQAVTLSDAHAKQEAYALGRAHGWEQEHNGKPVEWSYGKPKDIVDKDESKAMQNAPVRQPTSFQRERPTPATADRMPMSLGAAAAAAKQVIAPTSVALPEIGGPGLATGLHVAQGIGRGAVAADAAVPPQRTASDERTKSGAHRPDAMTDDIAKGLAPYQYEYKPGFSEREGQDRGEKNVGPMAQNMASNPVTGSAVEKGPDGLLYIDQKKALKLSLAAAGHNAQMLREQQAQINALKGGR